MDELSLDGWKYAAKCRVEGAKKDRKIQVLETEGKDWLYKQFNGYLEEKQPYQKAMDCACSKGKHLRSCEEVNQTDTTVRGLKHEQTQLFRF